MDKGKKEIIVKKSNAASYMKLDLMDRYDKEYEILKVIPLENDGIIWAFVGIVDGEKGHFYVRVDLYNETCFDTKYMDVMNEKLQEYSSKKALAIWEQAQTTTSMSFVNYTPNNKWDETASLEDFLEKERPVINLRVNIRTSFFEKRKEAEKIIEYIKDNMDNNLYALYTFNYIDDQSNEIGAFYYTNYRGKTIPTIEEIMDTYE